MFTIALCWVMVLSLPCSQDGDTSLVHARQLEQVSHRPEEALPLYEAIARDANAAAESRADAARGLVRCQLALGKIDAARAAAQELPARIGQPALTAELDALIASRSPDPLSHVVEASAKFSPPSLAARIQGLIATLGKGGDAVRLLGDMGDEAVPYLLAAIRTSTSPATVNAAVSLLAHQCAINPSGKAGDFYAALDQEQDSVLVASALDALSGPDLPQRLLPVLERLARRDVSLIKKPLIKLMAARRDDVGASYLQRMTQDLDPEVRVLAVSSAIRTLDDAAALEVARRAFRDPVMNVQLAALRAGKGRGSADLWLAAFESANTRVRGEALSLSNEQQVALTRRLTDVQLRALAPRILATLMDPDVEDMRANLLDVLADAAYLRDLPLTASDLAPLARGYGATVAGKIVTWMVHHPERGSPELLAQLVADAELAGQLLKVLDQEKERAAAVLDAVVAIGERQGWASAVGKRAFSVLVRVRLEGGSLSGPVLARVLAAPIDDLRQNLSLLGSDGSEWFVAQAVRNPTTTNPALLTMLLDAQPPLLDSVRILTLLRAEDLANRADLLDLLQRVATEDRDDVLRMAALGQLAAANAAGRVRAILIGERPATLDQKGWYSLVQRGRLGVDYEQFEHEQVGRIVRAALPNDAGLGPVEELLSDPKMTRDSLHPIREGLFRRYGELVASDPGVRKESGERFLLGLMQQRKALALEAWNAVRTLAEPTEAIVAAGLDSGHPNVQSDALGLVASCRMTSLRDRLEKLLAESPDSQVRFAAVPAVASFVDVRAGQALARSLGDENESVRKAAKDELDNLRLYLDEQRRWEEFAARGEKAATPLTALVLQTRDPDPAIRLAAAKALGALGDPAALPHLIELLRGPDANLRQAATQAIERLSAPHDH